MPVGVTSIGESMSYYSAVQKQAFCCGVSRKETILGEVLYYESGEVLKQLPREDVNALSLEVFKARLDGALGSLGWY